ncbi:MAG: discoidin domain-containing protein [Sedimentisphaerales bacterium]|nr:discoidin domain-containing protein [Sedimentisphaerales bacterium]
MSTKVSIKNLIFLGIVCLGLLAGSVWAQENVALGKPTTGSSTWEAASGPELAVDGIAPQSYPIFHSGSGDRTPWWQVDLEQPYLIKTIVLWNRQDCCQLRLRDIAIEIKDSSDELVYVTVVNEGDELGAPATITIDLTIPVQGQYVRVSRTEDLSLSGDDQYLLQLAEVQIYAQVPGQAYNPTPANGAARSGDNSASTDEVDVTLEWFTGKITNPDDPNIVEVDPDLIKHMLYLGEDPNSENLPLLAEIPAGDPIEEAVQYGPVTLNRDTTYYWRVDEVSSEATVTGDLWTFTTESSTPVIVGVSPTSEFAWSVESAPIAGTEAESAVFTLDVENPYSDDLTGMSFEWYKVQSGSDVKVAEGSSVFTIPTVTDADAGEYYCIVTLDDPATGVTSQSDNAALGIKQLLARWPFDGNLEDQIGDYDGAALGAPISYVDGIVPANGGVGQAVKFDGIDGGDAQAVTVPTAMIAPNTSWTFSFWEYTNDAIRTGYMLASGNPNGYEKLYIWRREGSDWANGNTDYYGNLNGIPTGWDPSVLTGSIGPINEYFPRFEWHQVTWTYDYDTNFYIWYVDGIARASANAPAPLDQFDSLFYIANRRNMARAYKGFIDDFRVYNFTMDAVEVAGLYTEVVGGYICLNPIANDLNGDCVINLADFAILAADWTSCNLLPAEACN